MFKIELKSSIEKDIRKIPQAFLVKIDQAIQKLAQNPLPKNSQKMRGYNDYYRLKVGVYRIIYRFNHKVEIIFIIKIGHRKEIYRKF